MNGVISNIKIPKAASLPQRDGHVHAWKPITLNTLENGKSDANMRQLDLIVATGWNILNIIIVFSQRILIFILLLIVNGLPIKFQSSGKFHVRRGIIATPLRRQT